MTYLQDCLSSRGKSVQITIITVSVLSITYCKGGINKSLGRCFHFTKGRGRELNRGQAGKLP
jgi:hypothetical protein